MFHSSEIESQLSGSSKSLPHTTLQYFTKGAGIPLMASMAFT